ncbi:serine hydrolase domain-containing protein [Glaciecola sp. 2405UD65-10]|uniref:serine hydrolase domain-containing protein n=1 Tax=Glaciecola sp. 2405UD65-10 TaxID=3397244 RepID=UPI003B5CA797
MNKSDFSGSVLVAHKGEIIFQDFFGLANRETNTPFNIKTVFDVGSITKQFTATAIMKLVQEDKLSLQSTLSEFFENVPEDKKGITLHHMLTHSAGFPLLAHPDGATHDLIYTETKREKFIEHALDKELLFLPGSRYHYSNIGYGLSASIIEKITGMPWELYIQQHILSPVGVKQTGYRLLIRESENLAVNYGRDPNVFQKALSMQAASKSVGHSLQHQYDNPGPRWHMEGAGGFLSTLTDMYHWYLALSSRKILNEASWQTMFTPYIAENKKATSHYGYGWALSKSKSGHRKIEHTGSNGYTYAVFQYYPDDEMFIFIATNNWDDYPTKLVKKIESLAFALVQESKIHL